MKPTIYALKGVWGANGYKATLKQAKEQHPNCEWRRLTVDTSRILSDPEAIPILFTNSMPGPVTLPDALGDDAGDWWIYQSTGGYRDRLCDKTYLIYREKSAIDRSA